jgi:hypothetical protein
MPWQEMSPMTLRMQFLVDWHTGFWSMTELCADYRISRKTGYKWVGRYAATHPLEDASRRPRTSPAATAPQLVEALVALRQRHPRWGARKLLAVLKRTRPKAPWPSRSTGLRAVETAGPGATAPTASGVGDPDLRARAGHGGQ